MKSQSQVVSQHRAPLEIIRTLLLISSVTIGATLVASAHDVTSATPAQTLTASAAANTGPIVQVDGTLAIIHTDHFAKGTSTHALVIHDSNGRDTSVRFSGGAPEIGAHVHVNGHRALDGSVDVTDSQVDPTPKALAALGSQNAIYVLVKFLDTASDPFSQADVQATAVTSGYSVANFYKEVSYGKQLL